jgi:hypothetical protein
MKQQQELRYRLKNKKGQVREGAVADLKSAAFYRVVARLEVGQRNTNSLGSAGIEWIERTQ